MNWTLEYDERLTALWAEGHSTAEVGRRMGVSKNAVVGRSHRLKLEARPSPIRRDGAPRPARPAPVPAGVPTLPPMPRAPAVRPPETRAPEPPRVVAPPPRPRVVPPCCWPLGEPGTAGFRFCDAPAASTRPYCDEHCARAYAKTPGWMMRVAV